MANAAERLTEVLSLLAESPNGMSATEVGERLGVTRAGSSRLLSLMLHARLVERDTQTQRYSLGLDLWAIASSTGRRFPILDLSLVPMAEAAKKLGTPLLLGVNHGQHTFFLRKVEMVLDFVVVTSLVEKASVVNSAIGKAIVAFDGAPRHGRGLDGLSEEIKEVRAAGYCVRRGRADVEDTRGVAAPIFDHTGRALAGVGTYWQSESLDEEQLEFALPVVRSLADSISRYMGYVSAARVTAL